MRIRQLRLFAVIFLCTAMIALLPSMAKAVVIIDQDVSSTATGWTGWGGDGTPAGNYFGILGLAVDDDAGVGGPADQLPLEALNGNVPFANAVSQQTLTIPSGFSNIGTYDVTLQVLNWGNFPMPTITAGLAGLAPSSTGINPVPASSDDEIWTFQFDVTAGNEGAPFVLTLDATGVGTLNYGVDHVLIEGPELLPPPPPFMPPAGSVPVGNDLTARDAASDGATEVFYTNYVPMPNDGTVGSVGIYSQGVADAQFEVTQLRPTGNADEYEVIYASGALTTTGAADEISHIEFPNGPTAVLAGDIFAHYGRGIPFSSSSPPGGLNVNNPHPIFFPVTAANAPGLGDILTLSDTVGTPPGVPIRTDLSRDYAMSVNLVPEPSSIILILLGLCSLGFWKMKK